MSGRFRIAIDVGGTFTDFVLFDGSTSSIASLKRPTTPDDPSEGILDGLQELGIPLAEASSITHGTTIVTNALIERRGPRTAFLVTEGHRDTLEMRRCDREELYDLQWLPPPPLIPRRHRLEIRERLYWDGEVAEPLDEQQVADVITTLEARGIESVAICFLNAYQHPVHEQRVKRLVEERMPGVFVTASHECSQEFREFERGSTTAANAVAGPTVQRYLRTLEAGVEALGSTARVTIMQSNGGICSVDDAGTLPVKLARSGPAGGAMALEALARETGHTNLVGLDIGGTSADVSVVVDGKVRWTSPLTVEWGLPLLFPSVDVASIGAGGGSVAWLDDALGLHVGPESAGASPGPACYGLGGTLPTCTDAHLVLGRMSTERVLGGAIRPQKDLAYEAIKRVVATPLGLPVDEAAEGILQIMNSSMLQTIRLTTIEKGYDPREFALVGFGGGGALHVADLARELGMKTAIVPSLPGVLSARGMLTVDMVQDRSKTILRRRRAVNNGDLTRDLTELQQHVEQTFLRQGVEPERIDYDYFLDMQYYGQAYSLAVQVEGREPGLHDFNAREDGIVSVQLPVPPEGVLAIDDDMIAGAVDRFHDEHAREFRFSDEEQEVQFVNARVFGRVPMEKVDGLRLPQGGPDPSAAALNRRSVRLDGHAHDCAVFDREKLAPGNQLEGPCIVEDSSATIVIPNWAAAVVDDFGNVVVNVA